MKEKKRKREEEEREEKEKKNCRKLKRNSFTASEFGNP